MAYTKPTKNYPKTSWVNDATPAISEDNLNKIEEGIYTANNIQDELNYVLANTDIIVSPILENGGINSSGRELTGDGYMRTSEYLETSSATNLKFLHVNAPTNIVYICYYNANKEFQTRVSGDIGVTVSTSYAYFRLSFYLSSGRNEATFRSWFSWIIPNALKETVDITSDYANLIDQVNYTLENGGINSSGSEITGDKYMRFKDYIPTSDANIVFKGTQGGGSSSEVFACYYNASYVFQERVSTTVGYQIDTSYAYVRLSFYDNNGADEQRCRSWIYWYNGNLITAEFNRINKILATNTFSKTDDEITIQTSKAQYIFKRVTDESINVDTWRLYDGYLITPSNTLFKMWHNSDAEGVIRLVDEDDFIGGFHGDEIMSDIHIFVDGKELNLNNDYSNVTFSILTIYVESDLYHCNTSEEADTKAFARNKLLVFNGNKVSVSNKLKALDDVLVYRAPLSLFQCYIDDDTEHEILHGYSANDDYKFYDISDNTYPDNSQYFTGATYLTEYGTIVVKTTQIDERYIEHFLGWIATSLISSQNRLKVYFDTIKTTNAGVPMNTGDEMICSFEWEIK